jgi:hypothetical protein
VSRNFRLKFGWSFETGLSLPEFAVDRAIVATTGEVRDAMFLGRIAEYQSMRKEVWLDLVGAHCVYVMGKRRSGKSYTLGVILEGLTAGSWVRRGEERQAVVVFDTMNVFLTAGHPARPEDIDQRWGVAPERLNLRFFHPAGTNGPTEVGSAAVSIRAHEVSHEEWCEVFDLDRFADPIAFLLGDVIEAVSERGYASVAGSVPAQREYGIDDMIACATALAAQYDQRTVEAMSRRLRSIQRSGIFNEDAGHVFDLVSVHHGSVLFLRDIEQELRSLFVSVFVRQLMARRSVTERYERLLAMGDAAVSLEERGAWEAMVDTGTPRTWIVIDEAHNYMPSRGNPPSRRPIKRYIDEGRNLGLSIVVATQQPAGLDQSVVRNADLLLFHSMTAGDDIDVAAQMVNSAIPETVAIGSASRYESRIFERVIRSLPRGYCLVSSDEASRVFPIAVRPRVSYVGGAQY